MQPIFKVKRLRSKQHLKRVAGLVCLVCKSTNAGHAHHPLRADGTKGMGLKTGDNFTVPLCAYHHHCLHTWHGGEIDYLKTHGLDYAKVVDYANKLWEETHGNE